MSLVTLIGDDVMVDVKKVAAVMALYGAYDIVVQDGKVTCFVADMGDDTWEAFEDAIRDIPSHAASAFEAMGITKIKVGSYT